MRRDRPEEDKGEKEMRGSTIYQFTQPIPNNIALYADTTAPILPPPYLLRSPIPYTNIKEEENFIGKNKQKAKNT